MNSSIYFKDNMNIGNDRWYFCTIDNRGLYLAGSIGDRTLDLDCDKLKVIGVDDCGF